VLLPAAAFIVANRIDGLTQAWYFWTGRLELFSETPLLRFLGHVEDAAVIALPVALLLGLARSRLDHGRISALVVELGELPSTDNLEAALRRALRDDALRVGVWDGKRGEYLDRMGGVLDADLAPGMVATRLEHDGTPVALMVHDAALLDEPGLVDATGAAVRLAVDNERLRAEVEAQLAEVRASRQRIVTAQDDERRRIERDLHDGAQQRLVSLAMALQVAESSLPADADSSLRASVQVAAEEARAALVEVREFALGVHPAVLSQRGVAAALRLLADRSAVPVSLNLPEEDSRLPVPVETAAYFVVAEGLTNVAKHARAQQAWVVVHAAADELLVSVSDDGVGPAGSAGSGLSGLTDRVRALGGDLTVGPREGGGTCLQARLPLQMAQPWEVEPADR
jgi:signal transduction histidine kinase